MYIKCNREELLSIIGENEEACKDMSRLDKIRILMKIFELSLGDAKYLVDCVYIHHTHQPAIIPLRHTLRADCGTRPNLPE